MKNRSSSRQPTLISQGFTLVELLVVIAIVAVLASLVAMMAGKMMLKAQKVNCVNAMRNITVSLTSYQSDFNRPPVPRHKDEWDTVLGYPGQPYYPTSMLVSVLTGAEDSQWSEEDGDFDLSELNPNNEVYMEPNIAYGKREAGIKEDGKLYDPWGNELMIAINSRKRSDDFNGGHHDKVLHTWGLAEWAETKPGYEDFVIWSYGKDGVKGKGGSDSELPSFNGSDDVKTF